MLASVPMRLLKFFPLLAFLFLFSLTAGCGAAEGKDEGPFQGAGGSPGGGTPDEGDSTEDPWHCAPGNWTAVLEAEGVYSISTDHYHLELEVDSKENAEELGRMAEAAWLALTEYFDGSPELDASERLSVRLFSTKERFEETLSAIGADPSGAGGYYSHSTRTAYLHVQPNPNYTNILFLHEMTHQFHHLTRAGDQNLPFWYVEGLAEYLSRHDWDGRCIRLGVIQMLSWEDLPSRALEMISSSGLDTAGIVSGTKDASRAESWAIVAYLERGKDGEFADAFAAYRALMDAGSATGPTEFEELLGPLEAFGPAIAAWLPTAQEPLTPIYTEWMHVAPGTVRSLRTGLLSLARVKAAHSEFETTVTDWSSDAQVGVLAGFSDTENYVAYFLGKDRRISEFKNVSGTVTWEIVGPVVLPSDDGSFHWTVSHTGSETQVEVNGISVRGATGFEPASGPAAFDSGATFTDMKWH